MSAYHRIGLITRPGTRTTAESLRRIAALVSELERELLPDTEAARILELDSGLTLDDIAQQADLGVVVGGDGTLLIAANHLAPHGVPMCGVNWGRLGFLADIYPHQITEALGAILKGQHEIDERPILVGEVSRGKEVLCVHDAINDIVVHSHRDLHMIELQIRIDGRLLSLLRADGLIVATPTGSTAYALSGGGPILSPQLNVLVLVPICPHMLSSRPIVIDADSEVELEIVGRTESRGLVSFDGSTNQELEVGDHIHVRHQGYSLKLVQPVNHNHFEVLRRKLSWNL